MRTTILLGTLLFLAGCALAQDSPITVGDSGSKVPPASTKTGRHIPSGQSLYVENDQFQYDHTHFISVPGYKAACFVMSPGAFTPVSLSAPWKLALNGNGVTLSSTDGNRIEIDYKQKPIVLHNMPNGDQRHEVTGEQLASGTLSNTGSPNKTYTPNGPHKSFVIHYCPGGACANLCK